MLCLQGCAGDRNFITAGDEHNVRWRTNRMGLLVEDYIKLWMYAKIFIGALCNSFFLLIILYINDI